jgi:SAM-dependent MidA family methyltransferase
MTAYDPEARRRTPLARKLEEVIARRGPLRVRDFMALCLGDSEHGYYSKQSAIGAAGDFITAPEISQTFGELIGLWAAVVWRQMGAPNPLHLIEVGPGRGTMMRDALRAAATVPGFLDATRALLIEPNETLREVQEATLRGTPARIAHMPPPFAIEETPKGPLILLANEVVDCLPVSQLEGVARDGEVHWHERTVGLDGAGRLAFMPGRCVTRHSEAEALLPPPQPGDVLEQRDVEWLLRGISAGAPEFPCAALVIDYGHIAFGYGDTLQAVRSHAFEHPLTSPGEADLTAHVDFAALAREARRWSLSPGRPALVVDGPVPQAAFLGSLGIVERASHLMAANPAKAHAIEAGVARLIAVPGMGERFKAIGIRSAGLQPLPGF